LQQQRPRSVNTSSSSSSSSSSSTPTPSIGVVAYAPAAWIWYQRAAAKGQARAQNNLAAMCLDKLSADQLQNEQTLLSALQLWQSSAAGGCAAAMFNLGEFT
jgi:hypothetical protein